MMRPTAERIWYGAHPAGTLLAPLGRLYCAIAVLRAAAYRRGWLGTEQVPAPVIVVGNLTVGGTGKTPLVLWLVDWLRQHGLRPGIAARGYGGRLSGVPGSQVVTAKSAPADVGDEPALLASRTDCPVVIGRDRVAAARQLIEAFGCGIVVTDDGLQHYRLGRDIEILVIDGRRRFGNNRCLPAGPLREPPGRAGRVNLGIINGTGDGRWPGMALVPGDAVNLAQPQLKRPLAGFRGIRITAVAGIGHPARFFDQLTAAGLEIDPRPYPDHHAFSAADIAGWPPGPVLMTEKDAVKCRPCAGPDHWMLPVTAVPDASFEQELATLMASGGIIQANTRRD